MELKQKLIAIICSSESKQKISNNFNDRESPFKIVANARNFQEMFNITSFPTTILLNQELKVVGYYGSGDEVDLKLLMQK